MLKILYLCTHNRCRSIIAEAVTNSFDDDRLQAFSAGSQPAEEVHPMTLKFLQLRSIDTSQLRSKSWHEFETTKPDVAITLCDSAAREACPTWLNGSDQLTRIHWGLTDPSATSEEGTMEQAFYQTIDTIRARMETLLGEISVIKNQHELEERLNSLALKFKQPNG